MNPTIEQVKQNINNFQQVNGGLSTSPNVSGAGGAVTASGMISQNGTTPITSNNLTPTTPVVLPETKQSTTAAGLSGIADGVKTTALNEQLKAADLAAKTAKDTASTDLKSIYDQIAGIQSNQATEQANAGIPQKAQAVTDATNKLEASQRAQVNELRAVDAQAGLGTEGAALLKQDINRKYAFEQADLALIQSAANRDYATAQSIVDNKIKLQLEPLQTKLDYQKQVYQDNKDTFTTAENRQMQNLITQSKNELDTQQKFVDQVGTFQLQALKDGNTKLFSALSGVKNTEELSSAVINNSINPNINSVTNPIYTDALNTILGSGKFTKEQKISVTNAINNGEDPFTVIKNQAKNIMGQTEATKVSNFEVSKNQIQELDKALTAYYKNGGKTNILTGTYEQVVNKLGEVNDPKLVSLATQVSSALQIYRNAVSGTAYSVQEGKDIASIFPNINKTEGLNKAIIDGRMKAFDAVIDGSYRNALGSNYDNLKGLEVKAQEALHPEQAAEDKLANYVSSNPDKKSQVNAAINGMKAILGRDVTASELLQAYPEYQ